MEWASLWKGTGAAACPVGTQVLRRSRALSLLEWMQTSSGILGFQDSFCSQHWAAVGLSSKAETEARRRGGSDASDFKSQLQRGQVWRTSPGMHGAGRMVEEPLLRDSGLTPSWGWKAEAKGRVGPSPASAALWLHLSPVPQDHQGHLPSSGPGFLLVEAMGGG